MQSMHCAYLSLVSHEHLPPAGKPYRAEVTAIGGRTGFVQSSDRRLRLELSGPMRAGAVSGGTDPEQLLAAAYASCFLSAIHRAGRDADIAIPADANVTARIESGEGNDISGGDIGITLIVDLPGIAPDARQKLLDRAHATSRCSRAMRGSLTVQTIAD
jgi:osmotically inducible protein OsmC